MPLPLSVLKILNDSNQIAIIVVTSLSEASIGSVISILVFMMVIHYWLNVMGNIKILMIESQHLTCIEVNFQMRS